MPRLLAPRSAALAQARLAVRLLLCALCVVGVAGPLVALAQSDPSGQVPGEPPSGPLPSGPLPAGPAPAIEGAVAGRCAPTPADGASPGAGLPALLTIGQGNGLVHESDGPMLAIGTGPEALDWQPGLRGSPAVAGLDFATDVLVGLFVGRRSTGGHRVTIESVTASGGGVCVTASVMPPLPEMSVTQAETYPYHVVAVKRAGLPLTSGTVWTAALPDGATLAETTIP